jgi:hypothetical protein
MASPPGHPLLESVIESLMANPSRGLTHRDVLEITGPLMLDTVVAQYGGQDVTVLPSHVAFPFAKGALELEMLQSDDDGARELKAALIRDGTFAVHYWANSWVRTLAGNLQNPRPNDVEGFTFYRGWDSPGHDIANVGRDIPRAAVACLSIGEAVAFNTDGFVKDALLPRAEWTQMGREASDEGLYVRRGKGVRGVVRGLRSLPGWITSKPRARD